MLLEMFLVDQRPCLQVGGNLYAKTPYIQVKISRASRNSECKMVEVCFVTYSSDQGPRSVVNTSQPVGD